MNQQLFDELSSSAGMYIPLYKDIGEKSDFRYEYGSPGASFPSYLKGPKPKTGAARKRFIRDSLSDENSALKENTDRLRLYIKMKDLYAY
jgi:hypothetical protein